MNQSPSISISMDVDHEIEVPEYFICPISLQIMRDPVTVITGITYDRRSIEHWIFDSHNSTCPVTKQRLPPDSDLTPNHTLRRLIHSWCLQTGVATIPTPKSPVTRLHVTNLMKTLRSTTDRVRVLRQLELLAAENDRTRKHLADAGVVGGMLTLIVTMHDESWPARGESEGRHVPDGIEEALSILSLVRFSGSERESLLAGNKQKVVVEALTWILSSFRSENHGAVRSHAVCVIRKVLEGNNNNNNNISGFTTAAERLEPGFFARLVPVFRDRALNQRAVKAALRVLLDAAGPSGRNRVAMVEAGAVHELVELELRSEDEDGDDNCKRTELVLGVLFRLCSCADGRAALLGHGAGVAVVAKKILRVSPTADDRAVLILSLICKHSCNAAVSREMLHVGAVMKLFAVLQVGCSAHLKAKASDIIRAHYEEWKSSPCIGNSNLVTNFLR